MSPDEGNSQSSPEEGGAPASCGDFVRAYCEDNSECQPEAGSVADCIADLTPIVTCVADVTPACMEHLQAPGCADVADFGDLCGTIYEVEDAPEADPEPATPVPSEYPVPQGGEECAAVWSDVATDFGLGTSDFYSIACSPFRRNKTGTEFGRGHEMWFSTHPTSIFFETSVRIEVEDLAPGVYDGSTGMRSAIFSDFSCPDRTLGCQVYTKYSEYWPIISMAGQEDGWVWGEFYGEACSRNGKCVTMRGRFSSQVFR